MQTQRKHQANTQHHGVLSAWHAQIADAARNPALKHRLVHQERELLPNFASHYTKLSALPRRTRRAMQRQWKRSLAGVALLLTLGHAPAFAATINVSAVCTLSEAIASANVNAPIGGCTTGAGADTVVLPAPPTPLPALTIVNNNTPAFGPTGLPVIAAASVVTLQGNGATIRRAITAPEFRIFAVAVGGTLTLQQTTISGGNVTVAGFGGGGVYNNGTLRLINSTIDGNAAVYGGGVSNGGTFTLTGSTLSGNTATQDSGGVGNYGTAILTNSTISGNTAGDDGGGMYNNPDSTATIMNSTISGNTAADDGGGVFNGAAGVLVLDSTLISGNAAPAANGREIISAAAITTNNFNLFGFNNNSGLVGVTPGVTDIVPDAGVLLADILDPLADNPGANPLIAVAQTHALVTGSPAVDAVGEGCPPPAVDQRGIARAAGTCDIGAFELAAVAPPPPTTPPPADGLCFGLVATITGTEIDESIRGTKGPDVINALGGDDTVTGGSGNDRLCGGTGNDTLSGGKGADRLDGGEETDECNGGTGPGKVLGPDTAVNCEAVIGVP